METYNYALITSDLNSQEPLKVELFPTEEAAELQMLKRFQKEFQPLFSDAEKELKRLDDLLERSIATEKLVLDEKDFFFGSEELDGRATLEKGCARIITPEEEYLYWRIQKVELPDFSEKARSLITSLFNELASGAEEWYLDEVIQNLMSKKDAEELGLGEYYPSEEEV